MLKFRGCALEWPDVLEAELALVWRDPVSWPFLKWAGRDDMLLQSVWQWRCSSSRRA